MATSEKLAQAKSVAGTPSQHPSDQLRRHDAQAHSRANNSRSTHVAGYLCGAGLGLCRRLLVCPERLCEHPGAQHADLTAGSSRGRPKPLKVDGCAKIRHWSTNRLPMPLTKKIQMAINTANSLNPPAGKLNPPHTTDKPTDPEPTLVVD